VLFLGTLCGMVGSLQVGKRKNESPISFDSFFGTMSYRLYELADSLRYCFGHRMPSFCWHLEIPRIDGNYHRDPLSGR